MFDLNGKVSSSNRINKGYRQINCLQYGCARSESCDIQQKRSTCEEVTKELTNQGFEAKSIPCHIGRKEDLESLFLKPKKSLAK